MSRADKWILAFSGALTGSVVTHYFPPGDGWGSWFAHIACMAVGVGIWAASTRRADGKTS